MLLAVAALTSRADSASAQVGALRVASGLANPTYLTAPAADFDRVFITERAGVIRILERSTGTLLPTPFLSLPNVDTLASLAFDPEYDSNGFFYVYYLDLQDLAQVVRYQVSAGDPSVADPSSAHPILQLTSAGHWGGWIGFGPEGDLYVQVGDGGDFQSHDFFDNGQGTTGELLGDILRVQVGGDDFPADPLRNYAIPPSNPFVGGVGEDEIWASGLRNPWRGSFDRATGDYYFADVGQDSREELNVEAAGSPGGGNYGWRLREGSIATPTGGVGGPQPAGGIDPVYEYAHGTGPAAGESITGGYVYRGPIAALQGLYFFGDFVNPRIWSIRVDAAAGTYSEFTDWTATLAPDVGSFDQIVSFGEDARGDLYIVDFDGEIFRIAGPSAVPTLGPFGVLLWVAFLARAYGWLRQGRWLVPSAGPRGSHGSS